MLPDTRRTHADQLIPGENFSNDPGKLAILNYRVHVNTPGRYYVWVRAFSTGSEDNGIHVGLNGQWPESGQRLQWCAGKHHWWWESKQRTQQNHCGEPHKIFLDIDEAGEHTISFSMREDGFEFDRWLMTTDREFARPTGHGPATTLKSGVLPEPFPVVQPLSVLDGPALPPAGSRQPADHVVIDGELKCWHKVTLRCTGPETSETASPNPFLDYRLNVTFRHNGSGREYKVPGYYAADGNAAQTSADSGNQWHVHFSPDETGTWSYKVDFRTGPYMAVLENLSLGEAGGFMDGAEGTFVISETDKAGTDLRGRGRLQYVGEHYQRFAGTGEYFLKCGADAPENLLAYVDFDGEFKSDGRKDELLKTWEPHIHDWQEGDPTWGDGKGKGLIGAINYLASKGMNSISFLTFNVMGDDRNVFPYLDYDERERLDVSRLAQWEIVFEHASRQGMFLHFKTQEHENQGLLDGGGVGLERKLYYRELIARFGHHLALNWNLGEENGQWGKQVTPGQDTANRRAMASYFHNNDPYRHLVVIHNGNQFFDMLGDKSTLTGVSVQTNQADFSNVHGAVLRWRERSAEAGKPWVVACDEPGDAQHSLITDAEDPEHNDARINALWGTLMAGGAGIEWYFGYAHPESDLTCQDWRSRDLMWDQCRIALDFFEGRAEGGGGAIPFDRMVPDDSLVSGNNYCLCLPGEIWVACLKQGGTATLRTPDASGNVSVQWFNPRNGTYQQPAAAPVAEGALQLEAPDDKDWIVVVRNTTQE